MAKALLIIPLIFTLGCSQVSEKEDAEPRIEEKAGFYNIFHQEIEGKVWEGVKDFCFIEDDELVVLLDDTLTATKIDGSGDYYQQRVLAKNLRFGSSLRYSKPCEKIILGGEFITSLFDLATNELHAEFTGRPILLHGRYLEQHKFFEDTNLEFQGSMFTGVPNTIFYDMESETPITTLFSKKEFKNDSGSDLVAIRDQKSWQYSLYSKNNLNVPICLIPSSDDSWSANRVERPTFGVIRTDNESVFVDIRNGKILSGIQFSDFAFHPFLEHSLITFPNDGASAIAIVDLRKGGIQIVGNVDGAKKLSWSPNGNHICILHKSGLSVFPYAAPE